MDSAKQEPDEISEMIANNLLELYNSDVTYQELNQEQEESTEKNPVKLNVKPCVKRNRFACRKCGRKFTDRQTWTGHEKRWSKLFCEICDEEFQCKFGLAQHIRQNHENETKCRKCPFVGRDLRVLRWHCNSRHKVQSVALEPLVKVPETHHACRKCGLEFGTRKGFREHQLQMGNFECLLCEEEFECEYARSQHLQRDHEEEFNQLSTLQKKDQSELDVEIQFECDCCGLSFGKKQELRYHMNFHLKFFTSCEECGFKSRDLTWHRKNYSGIFKCVKKNCKKVFTCKRALEIHMREDHLFKCPECPKIFRARKHLRNHRNKQHNKKFQCDLCELSFHKQKTLLHHKWKFHEKDMNISKLSCSKCEKKFETLYNLKKHKFLIHPNMKTKKNQTSDPHSNKNPQFAFVSVDSNESIVPKQEHEESSTVNELYSFENENDPVEENRVACQSDTRNKYACSKCGLEFGTRKGFREHQSQMGNFKCLLCDEAFECEHARSQHLERDHEKDINELATLQNKESSKFKTFNVAIQFQCDHCGLSFDATRKILLHMLDHLKFATSCEECGAKSHDINLTSHRKKYSGNFKCSRKNCGKVFKCKRALKIHARDEHEQNWKCPECPKILKTRKKFKSHLTIYHRNLRDIAEPLWISKNPKPESQCNQCQISFASKALLKFHMSKHKLHDAAMEALVFSCKNCGAEFESQKDLSLHQTIADEYNCTLLNENYNFKHSMVATNQQEKSSNIDLRLETVVKHEQEESSSETDSETETLGMNIHVKEEPEVSYVLKFPSEEEEL